MFGEGILTFREIAMREPHPLATIQAAVIEYLRDRDDAVLFGSHAVNAYVDQTRMTQDVDIMTNRGKDFADELCKFLNDRFHIAVRIRNIRDGLGFRIYQVRKPDNRHLVDVRPVSEFPPTQIVDKVRVVVPPELIAGKLSAWVKRRAKPKAGTDWRDLAMLLLTFPELKTEDGPVAERLRAMESSPEVWKAWKDLVRQRIEAEKDEDEFDY